MNSLILLWVYDKRWTFGVRSCVDEWLLILPTAVGVLHLVILINSSKMGSRKQEYIRYIMETVIVMIGCLNIWILTKANNYSQNSKRYSNRPNAHRIIQHLRHLQYTQTVAGWIGVSALFLDVILALLQKYSHFNGILYTGQQAFYLANMLSWLYLIVIAVIYIAIKASVLVHAWRCPRSYLMMHNKL